MSRLSSHRSALTSRVQPSRLKRRKVLISTAYLCWCRLIYSLLSDRCVSKFLLKPLLQCSLMQLLLQNIFSIPVTCPPNIIGVFFVSVARLLRRINIFIYCGRVYLYRRKGMCSSTEEASKITMQTCCFVCLSLPSSLLFSNSNHSSVWPAQTCSRDLGKCVEFLSDIAVDLPVKEM